MADDVFLYIYIFDPFNLKKTDSGFFSVTHLVSGVLEPVTIL